MAKKLPKIYQADFSHKIENNNRVFYSKNENRRELNKNIKTQTKEEIFKEPVEVVLDNLFNTKGYIFNIPVEIKTNKKLFDTFIAGKVKNTIITLDNDVIPIKDIISIKIKDRL